MSALSTHGIQRILPRHFKIIEMALAGHDVKPIADSLGMSPASVGLVLRSPIVQSEIARRRKASTEVEIMGQDRSAAIGKARSILDGAAESAAIATENLLLEEKPEIRLKAAKTILDFALASGKDERRGSVVNITAEQITLLNTAIKESNNELYSTHRPAANPSERRSIGVPGANDPAGGQLSGRVDAPDADAPEVGPGDVYEEPSSVAESE